MKVNIILMFLALGLWSCGGGGKADKGSSSSDKNEVKTEKKVDTNDGKGVGEIKQVTLNDPLNMDMVSKGKAIYEMKCSACHKLSDQRVVGPGFAGITEKRKPEWIMNMITNVDVMLDEDPVAQKLFEECLTRMPNQNVSIGDARDILEFLYDNDKGA